MSFTNDDLAAINGAIARGERVVRFADRTVEYRDVAELMKARDLIVREIAKASGSANAGRRYAVFRSGL